MKLAALIIFSFSLTLGTGCKKDHSEEGPSALEAVSELEVSAMAGDSDDLFSCGMMYYQGAEEIEADPVKAHAFLSAISKLEEFKSMQSVQDALTDLRNNMDESQREASGKILASIAELKQ